MIQEIWSTNGITTVHPRPTRNLPTTTASALAEELLGLNGLRLLTLDRLEPDAYRPRGLLRLSVESDPSEVVACRGCGVLAADHSRREHHLADAPAFGAPVQLTWRKRRWRCREPRCPTGV